MTSLTIRLSEKLKKEFADACDAREMTESSALRDLMTNFVRANKRQFGKPDEGQPITTSKPVTKPTKKIIQKRQKVA